MIEVLKGYRENGFHVILATSRNMNTYDGNAGLITANTAKLLMACSTGTTSSMTSCMSASPGRARAASMSTTRRFAPTSSPGSAIPRSWRWSATTDDR